MRCSRPFAMHSMMVPCGQCQACRLNKRRIWMHRIVLESMQYSDNAFVTLTYADEHLPVGGKDNLPTLAPKDMQDWLKRLRKSYEPLRLRFFGVGEYGDVTQRPHYHLCLFNYPSCHYGMSRYKFRVNCCPVCDNIRDTWSKGNIFVGQLSMESAQYCAGYVVKKLTDKDDVRLNGRHPEFARMSLRPGLGAGMMDDVAHTLLALGLEDTQTDVPSALRHGSRLLPLGRYLQKELRKRVGKVSECPPEVLAELSNELREMREDAWRRDVPLKTIVAEKMDTKVLQMETRERIRKQRKSL